MLCLAMPATALAEIYRWVDSNGKIHFSDRPSRAHSSKEVKLRINTYEGVSYDTASVDVGSETVVMYSAAWCGVCKKAKQYFAEQGIEYEEHDVEKSSQGKAAYKRLGGKGVPIILVGDRRMNGFSVAGFEKLYR
ncbi:MAG: glutaredoxin family protein [Gammaproteobacteria bacterium]|nr:glutaredoxin family protein [Gammaproteobacteria bacterium]